MIEIIESLAKGFSEVLFSVAIVALTITFFFSLAAFFLFYLLWMRENMVKYIKFLTNRFRG